MKLFRLLALSSLLSALSFCFTACTTAPRTIDAASTKLEIKQGKDKGFAFTFPKELDAKKFKLTLDPKSGAISLESDAIQTSSTGVIDSAGRAQAEAMAAMSKTIADLVPMLAKIAAVAIAPQSAPAVLAVPPPTPEDIPAAPAPVAPPPDAK